LFFRTQGSIAEHYRFSRYIVAELLTAYRLNPVEGSGNKYKSGRLLAGPAFLLPLDKKGRWDLTARALAGIQQTFPREIGATVIDGYSTPSFTVKPGFAYQAGAGMQYGINRAFFLLGNIDYLGVTAKYEEITLNGSETITYTRVPQNSIDLTLGAGLYF